MHKTSDRLFGLALWGAALGLAAVFAWVFADTPDAVTVDRATWLLDAVEIQSSGDTTLSFSERYGAYMDLDGTPFPQRFTGAYRGQPLYEYLLSVVELQSELPDSVFTIADADTMSVSR